MSILVGKDTSLIIQGITGRLGQIHAGRTLEYGVNLVAGVSPGKGGQAVHGAPVYDSVDEALVMHSGINASMILVPPMGVKAAALDAIEAGVPLVVIITEFVPIIDMMHVVNRAKEKGVIIVGPNTIGVISPGECKIGVMPGDIYQKGRIAVVSRSGTLTHEVSSNFTFAGFGQSTCLCIGGDPVAGINHTEALQMLRDDEDTLAVVLLGEIGGVGEEQAARYIRESNYPKPVFAYIAGTQAPEGKKMGHAGAIVSGGQGTAQSKIQSLTESGVTVAETVGRLLALIREEDARLSGALSTVTPIEDTD